MGIELDEELVEDFILETRETIDEVEATLIIVERARSEGAEPEAEVINRLFRSFHSVKGSAGFLGMNQLVTVTHAGENLLDAIRGGKLVLDTPQVDALCDALDFCRSAVGLMEKGKGDDSLDPAVVLAAIQKAGSNVPAPAEEGAPAPDPSASATKVPPPPPKPTVPPPPKAAVPPPPKAAVPPPPGRPSVPPPPGAAKPQVPTPPTLVQKGASEGKAEEKGKKDTRSKSIRVDVDKLEALMNMVGELILAETSVTHHDEAVRLQENDSYRRSVLQLNRVTRALQDIAMSLRMVPVEPTFKRMQRLVRDLAKKQEKDVILELTGTDTEVDKNLIEAIGDPLVHIIRNAIDHGLEMPDDRVGLGKPRAGTVAVDARHQAGEVWISVTDNGRGLDAEKIFAAAVRKGVVPATAQLSEAEVFSLIFEPGFSTAEKITDVSGRGVGMDVVRRNIQAMNGRIEVLSTLGEGTTVRIRVPLTLAIIEGMLVRVGSMRYTLPLLAIKESVPIHDGLIRELPNAQRIARIRGDIVPVFSIDAFSDEPRDPDTDGILITLEHAGRTFAIEVDELQGQRQTVVKGLPPYLARQRGLAGCSILPNGEITLILDLADIAANPERSDAA